MSARPQLVAHLWEGILASDFTLEHVQQRCYTLGKMLAERQWDCLIAYDTRFMSNLLAHYIARIMILQGVSIRLASAAVPLPAVQSALDQQQARCALVVSARNRPYWYNGLVLLEPDIASNVRITEDELGWLMHRTTPDALPSNIKQLPFPPAPVEYHQAETSHEMDLRTPYLEALRDAVDLSLIRRATMTIFVDPMNGTTAGYIPAVIGDGNQTMAIEINRETDPLFGKVTPLPMQSGLTRLRKLVRESDSHLGLAFSADGTALTVIDKNGEQLEPLEVVLLLAAYLLRQYRQKGLVLAPPPGKGTAVADALDGLHLWEKAVGLKVEVTEHATVRLSEMQAAGSSQLLVGCSSSGEVVLGHYHTYPDALLAGIVMIELVARSGGNLRALINELRTRLTGG